MHFPLDQALGFGWNQRWTHTRTAKCRRLFGNLLLNSTETFKLTETTSRLRIQCFLKLFRLLMDMTTPHKQIQRARIWW